MFSPVDHKYEIASEPASILTDGAFSHKTIFSPRSKTYGSSTTSILSVEVHSPLLDASTE